jgi:hypothetical protein
VCLEELPLVDRLSERRTNLADQLGDRGRIVDEVRIAVAIDVAQLPLRDRPVGDIGPGKIIQPRVLTLRQGALGPATEWI